MISFIWFVTNYRITSDMNMKIYLVKSLIHSKNDKDPNMQFIWNVDIQSVCIIAIG